MNQFQIGELFTIAEFKKMCASGMLMDQDGMGDLVVEGEIVIEKKKYEWPKWIYPSQVDSIPNHITHILWYNK